MTVCIICEKDFATNYLSAHKRRAHGIYGGKSGKVRAVKNNNVQLPRADGTWEGTGTPLVTFQVVPMIVLQDSNGTLWIAEKLER